MKKLLLAAGLALASFPAYAYQVYPGCTVPAPAGHAWYLDPVNGKTPAAWVTYFAANPGDTGIQGDVLHPWNSIQGVISGRWGAAIVVPGYTRPLLSSIPYNHVTAAGHVDIADTVGNPPVAPGDTLMLMTGNYGDLALGNFGLNTINSDWVTIKAVPGQTPVLQTLGIAATNKWIFDGVKVSSILGTNGNGRPLVAASGNAAFPTTDLVFLNMDVSSTDDATGATWTQAQWQTIGRFGVSFGSAPGDGTNGQPYLTCMSMTSSHIHSIRTGLGFTANNSLFSGNEIDHFGDDGILYGANNIAITHNFVHDNFDAGDGNHEDGMQGVIGPKLTTVVVNRYSNILIDSNLVIRQTGPVPFPQYLQGIDAFDSDWTNLTVTNNVVITSSCHGITYASVHNSLIANNTVVDDGQVVTAGCSPVIGLVGKTHAGSMSTNSRMTNNTSPLLAFGFDPTGDPGGNTIDHNVAQSLVGTGVRIAWTVNGVVQYLGKPGTYANGNIIDTGGPASEFTTYSPSTYTYNLTPKVSGLLIGAGSPVGALTTLLDIQGNLRTSPWTVGAFSHNATLPLPSPCACR